MLNQKVKDANHSGRLIDEGWGYKCCILLSFVICYVTIDFIVEHERSYAQTVEECEKCK